MLAEIKKLKDDAMAVGEAYYLEYVNELALPEYEVVALTNPNRKWRTVSGFQKAIRRGDVQMALMLGHALYVFDPDYVTRRTNVIATEDIGLANPKLLAAYMFAGGKRTYRREHGGELEGWLKLVLALCQSPKCRLGDDLNLMDGRDGSLSEAEVERIISGSLEEKLHLASLKDAPIPYRVAAIIGLVGGKEEGCYRPVSSLPLKESLFMLCQKMETDSLIAGLALGYSSKQRERQFIYFPLIGEFKKDTTDQVTRDDDFLAFNPVGSYPSYAFDWHNHEGKRAMSYFIKSSKPVGQFLEAHVPEKNRLLFVGMTVFKHEGHQVSQRLYLHPTEQVLEQGKQAMLSGIAGENFDPALLPEWYEIFYDQADLLHKARTVIAGSA